MGRRAMAVEEQPLRRINKDTARLIKRTKKEYTNKIKRRVNGK